MRTFKRGIINGKIDRKYHAKETNKIACHPLNKVTKLRYCRMVINNVSKF